MSALHQIITGYAQGGGVAPYNPASEFGGGKKGLWWDQSDLSTMYSDSGMTTQAVLNGPVLKIADKSGNGWHGTCTACTLRQTGGGLYYLETNGTSSEIASTFIGAASMFMSFGMFRASDDGSMLLAYPVASGGAFIGDAVAADGASADAQSGSIAYSVDGALPAAMTRNALNTAFTLTSPHVVQVRSANLSAWANFKLANYYSTLTLKGGFFGVLVAEGNTVASRQSVLAYQAPKAGATVVYNGGAAISVGDSTIAAYLGQNSVLSYVTTSKAKVVLASPGNTIAQQLATWNLNTYKPDAAWVTVQVGLNDLDPLEAATTALTRLQGLITQIRADVPAECKIVIAQMTPCRQRLIDIYGATNGPIAYQKWLDMNTAIAGNGATPITGVDGRVTAHVALLNDGSGNLASAYEITGTVDHIHENNAGRQIVATAWSDVLTSLGVL
jgi:lysophospholipase L1-like esterase